MKKTKQILATLLVVVMLVTVMASTALAANTINIVSTQDGTTYTLYKLFDLESTDGTHYSYKIEDTSEWYSFFKTGDGKDYVDIDTNGYVTWKVGADEAELAVKAGAQIAGKTEYGTYNATSTTLTINTTDEGYYLIKSSAGTLFGLATAEDGNTRTITEKTGLPNIGKTADKATASINDEITYTVTLKVETGGTNYVMYDLIEDGLTINAGSFTVTYNGSTLAGDQYVLSVASGTDPNGKPYSFKIEFKDTIGYESLKEIVVTYKATLNKNAEISTGTNDNTVWMTHRATNVNVDGTTVSISTFKFDLVKTDASDKVLDGAKFELYENDEATKIDVVKIGAGVYRVAEAGETGVAIETNNGVATIQGLDNGTYKIKETAAPDGYNKITDFATATISGSVNNNATIISDTYTSGGVQIKNNTGSLLPETGGIGTTIFYMVGVMLILTAVSVLVIKKRRGAEQ